MTAPEWTHILARLERACLEAGLDLVHAFGLAHWQQAAPEQEQLPSFGRSNALAVLIGNTKRLWPPFTQAHATQPELARSQHPLDDYVTERIRAAVRQASSLRSHLEFSHVTTPRAFPIQRLAERAGFAALSPSHLAIHPEHGPWFALRAVVTFDCDGPEAAPPPAAQPCAGCAAPCVVALARALERTGTPLERSTIAAHADDWIEVRRVCPVGQSARYGDAQLRYHYLHDRSLIRSDS